MKLPLKFMIFATLLAGLSVTAKAEDSSGMVVASRGVVVAVATNGESREIKQGDFIYVSDEIVTSNRSFAVVQFEDGSKVTVRPKTTLIIESYLYNCLLYTSPSPRDGLLSRMPSSA